MEEKTALARGLGRTLFGWSIASIIVGIVLYLYVDSFIQGLAVQAILWGIIDIVIAAFTLYKQSDDPAVKLARVLYINVGLDVIYQAVGLLLLIFAWQNPFIAGNGVGVIIQGAFLFVLDLFYYRKMKAVAKREDEQTRDV
jgi:hypothetical protein